MKKITILTMQLKKFGGIERFVTTLAEMMATDNEVTVVANYGKTKNELAFEMPKNVKVEFLAPEQPKEVSMKAILTRREFGKIPAELKRRFKINYERKNAIKTYFDKLDTDVIVTERATYNKLIGKYYHGSAKLIATDHNFHQNQPKYIRELIKSVKKFDYLVVATQELYDFYRDRIKAKCICIANALTTIPEKKAELNTKNVIAAGRFYPEKDFITLVDVMAKVHQRDEKIKLFLIGDGPERAAIEKKIKQVGLEKTIILTGALSQEEIATYYYQSSLFVMTSITEAFGLVLAEAMSYGLPVVAFDRASGARAQINEDVGVLIRNVDAEEMAEKIVELLENRSQLKKYQTNIGQKIKQYSKEAIRQDWVKIIQ